MSICYEVVSSQERIEREVTLRTTELRESVKQLEGFCCHVAHDLRDALSGIGGLAEIAYVNLNERQDCGSAMHSLSLISQQAHRSTEMLHGLLRLSQTRGAALETARVDVQAVTERVVQEVAVCRGAKGMPQVRTRPMPCVAADANLLHAVLFNLIKNAAKFAGERSDARIDIDATLDDAMVTVCVRDNGVGFDASQAEELFKPFRRLHGASYEGCGIGLSIVRHAVERHGGRVWAESAPGQGADFFFTLPAAD